MPEICWEETAEEILFVFRFDVWPGTRTLAFRPNKPTHYLLDHGNLTDDITALVSKIKGKWKNCDFTMGDIWPKCKFPTSLNGQLNLRSGFLKAMLNLGIYATVKHGTHFVGRWIVVSGVLDIHTYIHTSLQPFSQDYLPSFSHHLCCVC